MSRRSRRGAERSVRADPAKTVPGNRRFLSAAGRVLVPHGGSDHEKQYAGHAKRVMMGVWSFLRQFMYTKFVIVCDDDVNARDWNDVIWAITTRMDPARDTVLVENTPIDYLDFASPVSGLGSKMGLDATNKWPGETDREWGRPIQMDEKVRARVDEIWDELAIFSGREPTL